jgi:hypothetical protein
LNLKLIHDSNKLALLKVKNKWESGVTMSVAKVKNKKTFQAVDNSSRFLILSL